MAHSTPGPFTLAGNARFTVIAPECIRLEYSRTGAFVDAPSIFAADRDARCADFTVSRKRSTVLETERIRLVYTPDGKPFHAKNLKAIVRRGRGTVEWAPGTPSRGNLGGTIRTLDGVSRPVDLGEGLLSRDGWYLLDDSRRHLLVDGWVQARPPSCGLDWYLFGYGLDFKAALRAMTKIGGAIPLPRRYALGAWYSRYWPYSSKDYRAIVREYERHDFPLDVLVLDMDWHKDGWTGWSWNRKLLPDAEKLLRWLHDRGLFVTLNVHPADGVGPHEDAYPAFMKELGRSDKKKETVPFDAGDRAYLDALFKHAHAPLEAQGVDFWWLDWQQDPYTRSIPDLTNLAWLNEAYYRHTGRGGLRGLSFSRWAGWGDHRHPIQFSGDAYTDFETLAFEVPFTSTAGNVGCFFWSHDIGGHQGARNEESYVRWVQFGALTAALRSHSTRNKELDRRPWAYGAAAEESMRRSFHLRSTLFPYLYSSVRRCHSDSMPLNRPMYLEYPELDEAYRNPQQFLFGDALLAAPIVTPGVGPSKIAWQTVWLPEGDWYHWFTGEKRSAGDTIVAADLNEFPLFARGGVPIPLRPATRRMSTEPLRELIVRCYPGKRGASTLYEDDGVTMDYLEGRFALTELGYSRRGKTVTVTVGAPKGEFKGQIRSRSIVVELPCTRRAESAAVDGKPAKIEYDSQTFANRIRVSARESATVRVEVEEADPEVVRERAASKRAKVAGITEEALMAIRGVAAVRKNEGVYLYRGEEKTCIYNVFGLADGNSIRATLEDSGKVVLRSSLKVRGMAALPEIPMGKPRLGGSIVRTLRLEFTVKGKPVALSKIIGRREGRLSAWSVAGPFDFDPKKHLAPQRFPPESGKGRWRRAAADETGLVDFRRLFKGDKKLAYAATCLFSKKAQPIVLRFQSDDGIVAWLNGRRIHSLSRRRRIDDGPDEIRARLKAGRNVLRLKVSTYEGDWGFRVGLESASPVRQNLVEFRDSGRPSS